MFHQTPSHSLTLLSCENQPTFHISPLILYSVRMAQYRPQHSQATSLQNLKTTTNLPKQNSFEILVDSNPEV